MPGGVSAYISWLCDVIRAISRLVKFIRWNYFSYINTFFRSFLIRVKWAEKPSMPGCLVPEVSEDVIWQDFLVVRLPQANHCPLQKEVLCLHILQADSITNKVNYFVVVKFPFNLTLMFKDRLLYQVIYFQISINRVRDFHPHTLLKANLPQSYIV